MIDLEPDACARMAEKCRGKRIRAKLLLKALEDNGKFLRNIEGHIV